MRKAAAVAAIVVLAAILLAILLPRFISLESLKPRIVAAMEEKTGRKVAFSELSLSLFPGIGVKIAGLAVSGDPGHPGENLLSVPEAEIRLAIGPLFAGRAEFTRIILRRPEVLFRTYRNGTHSATEIANRLAQVERPAPAPQEEKVSVVLTAVSIEGAKLLLLLEGEDGRVSRWEIAPFTFRLSGIGLRRNRFEIETRIEGVLRGEIAFAGSAVHEEGAVSDPAMFHLSGKGKVLGQAIAVEGKMSAPRDLAEVDLTVTFPKIAMDEIPGIFADPPAALSKASPEGIARLTVKVSGNLQAMGFEAEADLARTGWTVGPGLRKFIDTPCTVVAQGHRFSDLYLLSNAELRLPTLLLIASASLAPSTGEREWAASARITSLADFARSRGGGLARYAPTGKLTASGKGKRPTASASEFWNVQVDLGDVGFQLPERKLDLRSLNGHVEIAPKAVDFLPLAGLLNGQRFTLRGRVSLGTAPTGQISLRMPYLDADALFPPKEGDGKRKKREATAAGDRGREKQAISARGNVRIDAGKARGLEFQDLAGIVRYEDGSLFLDSVRARLYGGEAAVSGRFRLAAPDPDFRVKVALNDVAAEEILSRKTALKDFLSGSASLTAEIGGGAKDFADFSRTAAGFGSFKVTGGKIRSVDLLATAPGLSGLGSVLRVAPAASGVAKAGETSFTDLSADFQVGGGKIRTGALRIVSGKLGLVGAAVLGFDRTLEFRGTLRLSREMSSMARGAAGRFLTDPSGRVEIPLVISGPVTSPAVAIDSEELARGMARRAVPPEPGRKLERLIEKFLPKRK
ncbi:MAG: AsmA family protein [Deltaproteobacteria bacterium]|nr:AsmA family protein [Deltaproteobacteria bacterium]